MHECIMTETGAQKTLNLLTTITNEVIAPHALEAQPLLEQELLPFLNT